MASTARRTTAYAAQALLLLAMSTTALAEELNSMTYKGCYSSSQPLSNQGSYTYQTSGYCQPICVKQNKAVLGLTNGNECWCGDELPAESSKVDDSQCNDTCDGYPKENCGGSGYWTVYLSGTEDNVPSIDGTGSTTGGTTTATVAAPSVVTHISPGKTVVVTEPASSASSSESSSGGGTNTTAVAAGVVVTIVVVISALAGLFFWLRHRRRQTDEEEYKRTQVADFMRIGDRKPPQTGYSSISDSRLEPAFGNKRNSHGSIADNEDFSRKILRVANPDRS